MTWRPRGVAASMNSGPTRRETSWWRVGRGPARPSGLTGRHQLRTALSRRRPELAKECGTLLSQGDGCDRLALDPHSLGHAAHESDPGSGTTGTHSSSTTAKLAADSKSRRLTHVLRT